MWIFGIVAMVAPVVVATIVITIYLKNNKLNIFDNKK